MPRPHGGPVDSAVQRSRDGQQAFLGFPAASILYPKILYDLKDINLLITLSDMDQIVDHLADKGQCNFISRVLRQDNWVNVQQDAAGAKATIEKGKYLFIYAMPSQVEVTEDQVNTNKKEDVFWKRSEVIRISSKSHVCIHRFENNPPYFCYCSDPPTHASYTEIGLSFFINFSNEIVRAEKIDSKSKSFRKVTASLLAMLQGEYVCWRGPHCFDNPEVNVRIFGDRFRKKARPKRHADTYLVAFFARANGHEQKQKAQILSRSKLCF
jgi:hypothetical protein